MSDGEPAAAGCVLLAIYTDAAACDMLDAARYRLPRHLRRTLFHAARGMSIEEAARAQRVRPQTVKNYRANVTRRLGAKNLIHAVTLWLAWELLFTDY